MILNAKCPYMHSNCQLTLYLNSMFICGDFNNILYISALRTDMPIRTLETIASEQRYAIIARDLQLLASLLPSTLSVSCPSNSFRSVCKYYTFTYNYKENLSSTIIPMAYHAKLPNSNILILNNVKYQHQ